MGTPEIRRAETAKSVSKTFLIGLTLWLAAPAPAVADEVPAADAGTVTLEEPPDDAESTDGDVLSIGEVTVTATRAERDVLEIPGHVTVIDRQEIERSGAATVADFMRRQSGIFVTNRSTNPTDFTVDGRGFNNGGGNGANLLVQVDGRRVIEPDTGVADWTLLPLDQVESIEIVRGSASALYGDNAAAGVVNIRTRAQEGPARGTVRGRVGRYDTGGGSLNAAATLRSVTGSLFVNGLRTDGYREQSFYSGEDYEGSLAWNIRDRVLVGAEGGFHRDFRELPGALTAQEIDQFGRRAVSPDNLGDETNLERGFAHAWVEAILADQIELSVRPHWRQRASENTSTIASFGTPTTFLLDTDVMSTGIDAQIQLDRPLFERRNRFVAGLEYLRETREGFSTSPFLTQSTSATRDVFSAFLQEELNLLDALLLTVGVRYDRALYDVLVETVGMEPTPTKPTYGEWSPKASITWRALPGLSIYGSYVRGFRLPTLDEASPFFGPPPDLDAQVSNTGEIGAKFRGGRAQAALALYWMDVHDEMLFDPFSFTNENLDLVRHRGIEAALSVQLRSWLQAYANYTFDDVEILEADDPLVEGARMPITPEHRSSFGLFAELPHDLEFTANVNIVGTRILANDFDQQLPKLPTYGSLDLLFAWRPSFGEHLSGALTFALRNATGEKYSDFGIREDFPTTQAAFYPAATRTWDVGLMLTLQQ